MGTFKVERKGGSRACVGGIVQLRRSWRVKEVEGGDPKRNIRQYKEPFEDGSTDAPAADKTLETLAIPSQVQKNRPWLKMLNVVSSSARTNGRKNRRGDGNGSPLSPLATIQLSRRARG